MKKTYQFEARLWPYPGKAAWHFITVPPEISQNIDYFFSLEKRGWGSLRVQVTIGQTTWQTSIFPDKKTHSYLLPIKAAVRKQEKLAEQQLISVSLSLASL